MSTTSGLLRCPKNLKECIDWVLRATERDKTGPVNIDKLKNALEAELKGSVNSNDLTQLVHGLCLFMGYPSCLCKPKKSVEESLEKISKELRKEDLKNYKCLKSISNPSLNCSSCKSHVVCKCCVIQSIKAVKEKCGCLKNPKQKCHCKDKDVSCSKVLAGLEACLHLQCLQSDMEDICKCNDPEKCCKSGTCNGGSGGKSCEFCQKLQSGKSVPTTGLGLSPPNPIRLAERLDKFFGSGGQPKSGCACTCGSGSPPNKSCCCLACENCSSKKSCFCGSTSPCSCAQALKLRKTSGDCPCK
ncbi:variant erythrocyte surface antigen-1, alpha subunit, partial [Babesia divergens]